MNYKILLFAAFVVLATFLSASAGFVMRQNYAPSSINVWDNWDTVHYLYLAEHGYCNSGCPSGAERFSIVFFPLYPFLIRVFNFLVGNYVLSSLIISNLCYILALYFLYALVKKDFSDDIALKAIIIFSAFPTAYFLHVGYTESLFIFLSVASFYFARNEKWLIASLLGIFASLSRINGVFLFPALLVEYMCQKNFSFKEIKADIGYICMIPAGFIIYLSLNYHFFGNMFQFVVFQKEHWFKYITWPLQGFLWALQGAFKSSPDQLSIAWMMEIFSAFMVFSLLIFFIKKIRLSYWIYAILNLIIITFSSFWMSIPRYALSIFPIFIILAILSKRAWIFYPMIFLFLMLQSLFLAQFMSGSWAF